jgi:hypothetical protein
MLDTVSAWVLDENSQYRREPARPPHRRQADFDARFDWLTVFYNCFRISDTRAMLIGPPLGRFPGILDSLEIKANPTGNECHYEVQHLFTTGFANRRTDNLCRVLIDVDAGDTCLHLQSRAGPKTLELRPNYRELFRGRRVLFTLSRNNDPQWICDWMRFHRDMQSADAVLLYDNGSTAYDVSSLLDQMRQVSGFQAICVVHWPYKYGPQGVGRGTWDSAFSQDGVMEDARWRYLADAHGALNCDIDELVLSGDGNVFDKAALKAGYVKFAGRWVMPPLTSAETAVRHRESTYQLLPQWRWRGLRLRDTKLCPAKWAVVPNRCPAEAHWSVHEIVGMQTRTLEENDTCYRHFTRIGTNWKNNRHGIERDAPRQRKEDTALQKAFAQVKWEQ